MSVTLASCCPPCKRHRAGGRVGLGIGRPVRSALRNTSCGLQCRPRNGARRHPSVDIVRQIRFLPVQHHTNRPHVADRMQVLSAGRRPLHGATVRRRRRRYLVRPRAARVLPRPAIWSAASAARRGRHCCSSRAVHHARCLAAGYGVSNMANHGGAGLARADCAHRAAPLQAMLGSRRGLTKAGTHAMK